MGNNFMNMQQTIERSGELGFNNNGTKMRIIKYINAINIVVLFEDGFITNSTYRQFQKGEIRNPYDRTIYNIGFIGEGNYLTKENKKVTKQYRTWFNMMGRCYDYKIINLHPTYNDCTVCEEWHNFQNFAKWYDENYYEIDNELMHLDKDILVKNNKIYSPNTSIFVPQCINDIFLKRQRYRGEYPIGVSFHKRETMPDYYRAMVNKNNEQIIIGNFDSHEEAFEAYKEYKEKIIKETADQYREYIPDKLYNAMYKYQVEITD